MNTDRRALMNASNTSARTQTYDEFLRTDNNLVLPATVIFSLLYILMAIWSVWELTYHFHRSTSLVKTCVKRKTRVCLVVFFGSMFFMSFFIVKRVSYDDKGSYEVLRGLADMSQMILLSLAVTEWNTMSRSLRLFSLKKKPSAVHRVLGYTNTVVFIYCLFRMLETAFRVPPLSDDVPWARSLCRGVAVAVYAMFAIAMGKLTHETSVMLTGLVAKRKAGDNLKRRLNQVMRIVIVAVFWVVLFFGLWSTRQLLKSRWNNDHATRFATGIAADFAEFMYWIFVWIPSTLQNKPCWCGHWFTLAHWFWCCVEPRAKEVPSRSGAKNSETARGPKRASLARKTNSEYDLSKIKRAGKAEGAIEFTPYLRSALEGVMHGNEKSSSESEHKGDSLTPALQKSYSTSREDFFEGTELKAGELFFDKDDTGGGQKDNLEDIQVAAKENAGRPSSLGMHLSLPKDSLKNHLDSTLMAAESPLLSAQSSSKNLISAESEEEILSFLHTVPMFSHLGELQFQHLAHSVKIKKYKVGDIIVKQGDSGKDATEMYIIQSGLVYATVKEATSDEGNRGGGSALRSGDRGSDAVSGVKAITMKESELQLITLSNYADTFEASLTKEEKTARNFLHDGQYVQKRTRSSKFGGQSWKDRYLWIASNPERLMWCHGESANVVDAVKHNNFIKVSEVSAVEAVRAVKSQFKIFQKGKAKSHALMFDVYDERLEQVGEDGVKAHRDRWVASLRTHMQTVARFELHQDETVRASELDKFIDSSGIALTEEVDVDDTADHNDGSGGSSNDNNDNATKEASGDD